MRQGHLTQSSNKNYAVCKESIAYHAYFVLKLGDQDKAFAPHMCCKTCVEGLRIWSVKKIKSLPFAMVWREGKDHVTDCYLCMTNLQGMVMFILYGDIFFYCLI